jgi:hypothetical protein
MATLDIETTALNYRVARPGREAVVNAHQQIPLEWWESARHQAFVTAPDAAPFNFSPFRKGGRGDLKRDRPPYFAVHKSTEEA